MGCDEADQPIKPVLQDAANIVLVVCPVDAENGAPLKLVVVLSMSGLCSTASSRLRQRAAVQNASSIVDLGFTCRPSGTVDVVMAAPPLCTGTQMAVFSCAM